MPLDLQAKLLRVSRIARCDAGRGKDGAVDFPAHQSTNLDPTVASPEGHLRQDLYFRINTVTVTLRLCATAPRLPVLANAFWNGSPRSTAERSKGRSRSLSPAPVYRWPGNVRELETHRAGCTRRAEPADRRD